jgi:hypothetical protein
MSKVRSVIKPIACGEVAAKWGMKDDNACTVRALANAAEITFPEAYETLKKYGRKDMHGAFPDVFVPAYKDYGFELAATFGTTNSAIYMARMFKVPRKAGITLSRILPYLKDGSYIVTVTGHALAVVDGEIIDTVSNSGAKSVCAVFKKV